MIAPRVPTGRVAALLSLLLPLVVAGDTPHGTKSPNQSTMTTERISLSATFQRVGTELSVRYSVDNQSDDTLLIYDRIWRWGQGGRPFVDPQRVYRSVNGSGLRLLLGAASVPPMKACFQIIPAVIKVDPYSVLRGEVSVPVPVTEYNCYESAHGESNAQITQDVELFVDYSIATGVELFPSKAFPSAFQTNGSPPRKRLRSGQSRLALEVLRRTSAFPRLWLPGE